MEYADYEEREEMKRQGWEAYRESKTIAGRAAGISRVIQAHFWRAQEHLGNMPHKKKMLRLIFSKHYTQGYEMDIDHYTPHWLWANGDSLDAEVLHHLALYWSYTPQESKYLPKGHTSYAYE